MFLRFLGDLNMVGIAREDIVSIMLREVGSYRAKTQGSIQTPHKRHTEGVKRGRTQLDNVPPRNTTDK